ncbi:jg465, partial [Pararge aegeria aegeria]
MNSYHDYFLVSFRFAINLQCGPNTDPRDDIALHLNFRFVEMCIVRNHLSAMSWGVEETNGGMPLGRGDQFEALVLCEPQSLKVALNGQHFCEFPHRLPHQRITHFTIDGDVMVQFVGFEGAQPPPTQMYMSEAPAYAAYGAPPTYGAPGYGAPQDAILSGEILCALVGFIDKGYFEVTNYNFCLKAALHILLVNDLYADITNLCPFL